LIYYRDPLLDKISDRILALSEPAFIKNSERVFVACNDAFAGLFNLSVSDLVGTAGDHVELQALLDIEDKERACLVFGEDQVASFSHPFGSGRFRIELERFTLADGQTFLYCVFNRQKRQDEREPTLDASAPPEQGAAEPAPAPAPSVHGTMFQQHIEHLLEVMGVGICIFDRDKRLIYFNEKLRDLYRGLIDGMHIGMGLRDIVELAYDNLTQIMPETFPADADARRRFVAERVQSYNPDQAESIQRVPNGKWVKSINHRLPDGSMVGLRLDVSAMKAREEELERLVEEAGLYRELLNRLQVAAFARGEDQALIFANPAYADFFGRTVDDLIGTTEQDLFGERAAPIIERNRDTLANGTEYEREEETPVAGGRLAGAIVRSGRLITEQGKACIVGTVIDISPIRQREQLLREATEKAVSVQQDLENIIANVQVGLLVLDRDLRIQLVNQAYRDTIWGSAAETWQGDLVGRFYRELLEHNYNYGRRPQQFPDFEAYFSDRIAEIQAGRVSTREVVFEDGSVILYSGIKLSGGSFLLSYVDLSELRRRDRDVAIARDKADKALRLVQDATDAMPEGLMVIEGDYLIFSNPGIANVINVPPAVLVPGSRWEDVYRATARQNPDQDEASIEIGLERFRAAIKGRLDLSYDFPLNGERWVHLEMRSRADGQCVILCTDQTSAVKREAELKRLILRAEAADRAKSEFIANMSLEIRTPMNGILGMAELLGKSSLDTRQKAFIDIIMKSGHALMTIINDILDFSKLDTGHLQLKYAPFDPSEALEDIASLFSSRASEKGVELLVRRDTGIPAMVMGDGSRFRQILNILISNAVKYTDSGHVIASIAGSSDSHGQTILCASIEDTGTGIPAAKLGTIFDKFTQVELTSNRREGTGLGLAIAQRLANLQGGMISVDSSEGRGSIFTLTLPMQTASGPARHKPLPANVEGARLLVIDDLDIVREHLLERAAEWGFECVDAPDAATGLSILAAAAENGIAVDAVLVDYMLPDMNSWEIVNVIRNAPGFEASGIILLTTPDFAASETNIDDVGADACLIKPVRTELLRETLIEVIRSSRARRPQQPAQAATGPDAGQGGPADPQVAEIDAARADGGRDDAREPYVLVAEDNEVNQLFFSQILLSAGLRFRVVASGEAACDAWMEEVPAMIIMDTSLPDIDGFEVTLRIRTREAVSGGHTPIIGVITHSSDHDAARCIAAGMDDYITKPIRPERLEEKIRLWMDGTPAVLVGGF
jgi:PAS domain S-box-containing protein